ASLASTATDIPCAVSPLGRDGFHLHLRRRSWCARAAPVGQMDAVEKRLRLRVHRNHDGSGRPAITGMTVEAVATIVTSESVRKAGAAAAAAPTAAPGAAATTLPAIRIDRERAARRIDQEELPVGGAGGAHLQQRARPRPQSHPDMDRSPRLAVAAI